MPLFTLYISKDKIPVLEKMKEIAKREGKPLSAIIWSLLEEYIKKHGEGNPNFQLEKWVEQPNFKCFPTLGENPDFYKLVKEDPELLKEIYEQADRWKWVVWRAAKAKGLDL